MNSTTEQYVPIYSAIFQMLEPDHPELDDFLTFLSNSELGFNDKETNQILSIDIQQQYTIPPPLGYRLPDTSSPPPPLPPGFGSFKYPTHTDILARSSPPEEQMKELSLMWREMELIEDKKPKRIASSLYRIKHKDTPRYCGVCSETKDGSLTHHQHYSSRQARLVAPSDEWGLFSCKTCKISPHSFKSGTRYSILLTSSTLNNWQGDRLTNKYEGDPIHVDYISIPGGTIDTLIHAFMAEYGGTRTPVDVLLVCGLNDLRDEKKTAEDIMKSIQRLAVRVRNMPGVELTASTLAVATLPFAPCMTSLPSESRQVINDKTAKLVQLNTLIRDFNMSTSHPLFDTSIAPCFHTWGLKSSSTPHPQGPLNVLEKMDGTRRERWREQEVKRMLHLNDSTRLRMGKACIKYFIALYGSIDKYIGREGDGGGSSGVGGGRGGVGGGRGGVRGGRGGVGGGYGGPRGRRSGDDSHIRTGPGWKSTNGPHKRQKI